MTSTTKLTVKYSSQHDLESKKKKNTLDLEWMAEERI